MQPNSQSNTKPNAASELDQIFLQLTRELAAKPGRWHACPQRACRRHHRCASRDLVCATTALSAEQQAATLAQLNRCWRERGE